MKPVSPEEDRATIVTLK